MHVSVRRCCQPFCAWRINIGPFWAKEQRIFVFQAFPLFFPTYVRWNLIWFWVVQRPDQVRRVYTGTFQSRVKLSRISCRKLQKNVEKWLCAIKKDPFNFSFTIWSWQTENDQRTDRLIRQVQQSNCLQIRSWQVHPDSRLSSRDHEELVDKESISLPECDRESSEISEPKYAKSPAVTGEL